jgi:hypothetical protein
VVSPLLLASEPNFLNDERLLILEAEPSFRVEEVGRDQVRFDADY